MIAPSLTLQKVRRREPFTYSAVRPFDPDSAVPAERQEVESRLQAAGNRERTVLKRKSPKAASKGTSKVKMQKGY